LQSGRKVKKKNPTIRKFSRKEEISNPEEQEKAYHQELKFWEPYHQESQFSILQSKCFGFNQNN
jgi:hypothetical protein